MDYKCFNTWCMCGLVHLRMPIYFDQDAILTPLALMIATRTKARRNKIFQIFDGVRSSKLAERCFPCEESGVVFMLEILIIEFIFWMHLCHFQINNSFKPRKWADLDFTESLSEISSNGTSRFFRSWGVKMLPFELTCKGWSVNLNHH